MTYISKAKKERESTARHRFYIWNDQKPTKWRFLVCDNDRGFRDKTIGKFTNKEDAELFLEAKRNEYINKKGTHDEPSQRP